MSEARLKQNPEQIDLSQLAPAPWRYVDYSDPRHPSVLNGNGDDITVGLYSGDACFDEQETAQFIVLARNAFDVMMRRGEAGWCPCLMDDGSGWYIVHSDQTLEDRYSDSGGWVVPGKWPDPFTALVEADKWYKSNVEKVIAS